MSETSTVLVLIMILTVLALLSANYTEWVNLYNIESGAVCTEVHSVNWLTDQDYIIGMECEGDIPMWFNLIWVVPIGIALIYAVIPFVKG